mgnify:CR=1 FL=1
MALHIRGLQRGELDGFLTCFQAAFGVDDQSLAIVRSSLVNDPYFQPDRVRVGVLDGMVVCHAVVLHRAAYVGGQVVTVAGITAVATHPYYQGRGLGTRVMQDTMRLVRRRGYDLAKHTTRAPRFFARLGFREVLKVDGFACPAAALARLELAHPCRVERLHYEHHWPALAAIYHQYSQGRTGMQVRDMRCWETWPRRGTFPYGFSSHLDANGFVGLADGRLIAYLASYSPPEQRQLVVTDIAHLPGQEEAAATLLREAAQRFIAHGPGRTRLQVSGGAPLLALLQARGVPLEVEVGPGLMVAITNPRWLRPAGFRDAEEAVERLFRGPEPTLWYRDGY